MTQVEETKVAFLHILYELLVDLDEVEGREIHGVCVRKEWSILEHVGLVVHQLSFQLGSVLSAELAPHDSVSGSDGQGMAKSFGASECNAHSDEHHNSVKSPEVSPD